MELWDLSMGWGYGPWKKIQILGTVFMLYGCAGLGVSSGEKGVSVVPLERMDRKFVRTGKMFGELSLTKGASSVVISPALWHGGLQVLSAFPLEIMDQEKGILQTHWYATPEYPKDRFQIRILFSPSAAPCVEAVVVSIFCKSNVRKQWKEVPVSPLLVYKVKEHLLQAARKFQNACQNSSSCPTSDRGSVPFLK